MARQGLFDLIVALLVGMPAYQVAAATLTLPGSDSGSVKLHGTIAGKPLGERHTDVFVFDDYLKFRRELDGRRFRTGDFGPGMALTIDRVQPFTYIRMDDPELSVKHRQIWLFLMPGDSLRFDIDGDRFAVSGNGAERIACLNEIHGLDWGYLLAHGDVLEGEAASRSRPDVAAPYREYFRQIDILYRLKMDALEKYRDRIGPEEFAFIASECLIWSHYEKLDVWSKLPAPDARSKAFKQRTMLGVLANLQIPPGGDVLEGRSLLLADFLAKRETMAHAIANPDGPGLEGLLDGLSRKLSGVLYQRVVACMVSTIAYSPYKAELDMGMLERIRARVAIPKYRRVVESYLDVLNSAIDLDVQPLIDTMGRETRLSDFAGKLVVVDFWFTGCTNCVILARSMEPVVKALRGRSDIVFLSINMDKTRPMWVNSLVHGVKNLGFYSHEGSVDVSTQPDGFQHALVRALNITGAPELIIIGKKGGILNRDPPRPNHHKPASVENFRAMLDGYLANPD